MLRLTSRRFIGDTTHLIYDDRPTLAELTEVADARERAGWTPTAIEDLDDCGNCNRGNHDARNGVIAQDTVAMD